MLLVDKQPSPTLSDALWDLGELGDQELESDNRALPGRDGGAKPHERGRGMSPFSSWPFWKLKDGGLLFFVFVLLLFCNLWV